MRHYGGEERREQRRRQRVFCRYRPMAIYLLFSSKEKILFSAGKLLSIHLRSAYIINTLLPVCRCLTKHRGREADVTSGKTQLNVQHALQRVTSSFDHLQCSDEFCWSVSDKKMWDFLSCLASRYYERLWFISWSNKVKHRNFLYILNVQGITISYQDSFQYSCQDSPGSSWTFSALRTCRSTIFAIEIASISGREHLSDDKHTMESWCS